MGAERWLPSQSSWGARREVRSRCSVIYSINIYRAASRGQAFARGAPGAAPNGGPKPCLCEAGVPSGRERPALHRLGPEKKRGGGGSRKNECACPTTAGGHVLTGSRGALPRTGRVTRRLGRDEGTARKAPQRRAAWWTERQGQRAGSKWGAEDEAGSRIRVLSGLCPGRNERHKLTTYVNTTVWAAPREKRWVWIMTCDCAGDGQSALRAPDQRLRPGGNGAVPPSGDPAGQPRPQNLELHPHRDGK